MSSASPDRKTGFARLLEFARSKKWYLISACSLGVIATFLQFFPTVLVYFAVEELVDHAADLSQLDAAYLRKLALYMIGCFVGSLLILFASVMLAHIAAFTILYEIRMRLVAKLSRLSLGFFSASTSGSVRRILGEHVDKLELFIAHHIVDMSSALFVPLSAFIAMAVVDWRLLFPAIIVFPIAVSVYALYSSTETTKATMARYYEEIAKLGTGAVEFVNGMPVVKIFNRAGAAVGRFAADITAHADMVREWFESYTLEYSVFMTLIGSSLSLILPVGVIIALFENDLSQFVPRLVFFLIVGGIVGTPFHKLLFIGSLMTENSEGIKHVDEILYADELLIPENAQQPTDNSIEFENVMFSHGEEEVLHGISFRVESGQLIGLVGPSGGGKTTIAQLAARFWDIQEGSIRLGGVDVRNIAIETLMDAIAFVFQDTYIFRDTVEANIRMGNVTASIEEVQRAASAAQADEFISRLPQGYATVLGEQSVHLSGGEKQRIAIARAILKNPPVIVLDEATVRADAENESRIQAAFSELTRGKTVLVIAHNLLSIRHADCILVVDGGRITERGTHDELMELDGLYKTMVSLHERSQNWALDVASEGEGGAQ
jgi:ATP-binding cassette subfamily B protein